MDRRKDVPDVNDGFGLDRERHRQALRLQLWQSLQRNPLRRAAPTRCRAEADVLIHHRSTEERPMLRVACTTRTCVVLLMATTATAGAGCRQAQSADPPPQLVATAPAAEHIYVTDERDGNVIVVDPAAGVV